MLAFDRFKKKNSLYKCQMCFFLIEASVNGFFFLVKLSILVYWYNLRYGKCTRKSTFARHIHTIISFLINLHYKKCAGRGVARRDFSPHRSRTN